MFGDIHGNTTALEAVVKDIEEQDVDARICLGDLAFRGPQPVEALTTLLEMGLDGLIVGNTDQWLFRGFPAGFAPGEEKMAQLEQFRTWALAYIGTDALKRLESLPMSYSVMVEGHTLTVVHSSPRSTEDWYAASSDDERLSSIFEGAGPCDILVYGHIHTPFIRRIRRRWLINTGSVGNPTDGDARASYLLLQAEDGHLTTTLRRVPYDVGKVTRAALERDFPYAATYAAALRTGQSV